MAKSKKVYRTKRSRKNKRQTARRFKKIGGGNMPWNESLAYFDSLIVISKPPIKYITVKLEEKIFSLVEKYVVDMNKPNKSITEKTDIIKNILLYKRAVIIYLIYELRSNGGTSNSVIKIFDTKTDRITKQSRGIVSMLVSSPVQLNISEESVDNYRDDTTQNLLDYMKIPNFKLHELTKLSYNIIDFMYRDIPKQNNTNVSVDKETCKNFFEIVIEEKLHKAYSNYLQHDSSEFTTLFDKAQREAEAQREAGAQRKSEAQREAEEAQKAQREAEEAQKAQREAEEEKLVTNNEITSADSGDNIEDNGKVTVLEPKTQPKLI